MQVTVRTVSGLERRLEVAVPADRVSHEIETRLQQIARTARLKGFRPGKAPMLVVRQQFSSQVRSEVFAELLRGSYSEAITQQQIRPACDPQIEILASDEESGLRYAAQFEVMPEIPLPSLADIVLSRHVAEVTPHDVEQMLNSMRRQRLIFETEPRPAVSGDRVTVDFEGTISGEPFNGGSAEGVSVILGRHQLLPEFEMGVVGMAAGETKTISITFPDDYQSANIAGKMAEFRITMIRVEKVVLPELDDTFCQYFGILEGGVETLRAEVTASMNNELDRAMRGRLKQEVMDKLSRSAKFDVPRGLVAERAVQIQRRLAMRSDRPDAPAMPSATELETAARDQLALELITTELIRVNNISIDRELVSQRLEGIVQGHPNADDLRRQYLQNPEFMAGLERAVLEDQLAHFVAAKATIVDVSSSFGELTGFGQGAAA